MEEFDFENDEEDIDELILKIIKSEYKTVAQIAIDLNINKRRISMRMRKLRKRNEVVFRQVEVYKQRGIKPLEYKKNTKLV